MNPSEAKFTAILKEYQHRVYRQAFRILGDACEAEEVTQDVFLSVYRNLNTFRGEANLATWIYRIAANACISRRRRAKQDFVRGDDEDQRDSVVDEDPNPEEFLIRREAYDCLDRFIASLPDKEAIAISLFYYEEKSYEEIAAVMNIPLGTVAALLHRGRAHLHTLVVSMEKEFKQ
jgi:RNA polymerase sigma-70 factor, ECF subfamily